MATDARLLERLKFGDKTALESICDKYHVLLWKICYREFKNQLISEQVLTRVFQQLWKHPEQFGGSKSLMFYLIECVNREITCQQKKKEYFLLSQKNCS